ncbi:unnamed protein product, partial [Heligmosomoides polygyrus]|uniref:Coiled-coil domain-containing protein 25 n=1 Tax=Heligmosomoides polygyrus TaxID=6339 RepID=A0A183GLB0_HELPZ
VALFESVSSAAQSVLLQYGWPEDVWFHVDKVSSAHVYLRLPKGMTIDTIPQELVDDCCQLVKANSIDGNKMNDVGIVYTMWENLKKTGDMAVGITNTADTSSPLMQCVSKVCSHLEIDNFTFRVRFYELALAALDSP